jgi:hypothetical protein
LNSGCKKDIVKEICMIEGDSEREGHITRVEMSMGIFEHVPFGVEVVDEVDILMHRMKERETWFKARIVQLEEHCNRISSELALLKKGKPDADAVADAVAEKPLTLNLGDTSLPYHERIAKNLRYSILEDEGFCGGMTPAIPLPPMPSSTLKKEVSWNDLTV